MKNLLKSELERVGPSHISRIVKANTGLHTFINESTCIVGNATLAEKIYLILNNKDKKPTCFCGRNTTFISIKQGYRKYCSVKCSKNSPSFEAQKSESLKKRKKTNLKKYGVENPSQSELVKKKKRKTFQKRYGVNSPLQSKEILKKVKKTNLKRYGNEIFLSSDVAKKKIKETNLQRYGVENPMQCEKIKNKSIESQKEKYGGIGFQLEREKKLDNVDWDEVRNKVKQTNLEKLGVEMPFQSNIIQEKVKQTNLEKYGVDNPFKSEEVKDKIKQTNLEKYGVENPSFSKIIKAKIKNNQKKTFYSRMIKKMEEHIIPLFDISDYNGVEYCKKYKWQCITCGFVFEDHMDNGYVPLCPICYPKTKGISILESEIFEKINHPNKIQSDRIVLNGKELDIYIPDKKLAIEFNGVYWHSEQKGKDKDYHLNKTIKCEEKGIQLLHIFDTEWLEKQPIVESIIDDRLGKFKKRIYIKKCFIEEIDNNMKDVFLEKNHIKGTDKSSIKLGLFRKNELVSILTVDRSNNDKYQYEIYRICNKIGYQIIGAERKLWKYFTEKYNPKSVKINIDRRFFNGQLFKNIGFNKIGESKPNYFYFKSNSGLIPQIKFQKNNLKDKLDIYDSELTEWENMQNNGYNRIWDCGNFIFGWKK